MAMCGACGETTLAYPCNNCGASAEKAATGPVEPIRAPLTLKEQHEQRIAAVPEPMRQWVLPPEVPAVIPTAAPPSAEAAPESTGGRMRLLRRSR